MIHLGQVSILTSIMEYGIIGEGSQISTNQKRENSVLVSLGFRRQR